MSIAFILLQQIITMFLLVSVGYLMFRCKKISPEGSKSLGNILIYLSLPCVIIKSFLVERTGEALKGLLISALAAALVLAVSILISRIFFKKDPIAGFASAFSNPGFFGIPLITASISEGAVFYIAAFIAFLNMLQWTYGVSILTADKKKEKGGAPLISVKKIVTAPFMVAIIIGLFFFLSGLKMPAILNSCINFIAGLNTPLAMFTIGIYLAQTDIAAMFRRKSLYLVSLVRLVIIPVVSFGLLCLMPGVNTELRLALLIASACPVGSNVAVYAQLHDQDYPYAVETVVISTMFSLITIPLLMQLAYLCW